MHDPMTLVYSCRWFDLWHVDPERDGSDDSCGWFPRSRHGDAALVKKIVHDFQFEGRDGGAMSWFGDPKYAPGLTGVGLSMFRIAANHYFGHWSRRADRFLARNLFNILHFVDNGCDSINEAIRRAAAAEGEERKEILKHLAHCVYGWILRQDRPWYRHPRWHVHHWKLTVHPLQSLKRWLFSRCCRCGGRFPWGYAPVSGSWDGTGPRWFRGEENVYHHDCAAPGRESRRREEVSAPQ